MIYNIFFDSNREIAWSCTAPVTDEIKTEQKSEHNYDFLQYDCDNIPNGEDWYINPVSYTHLTLPTILLV